MQQKDIFFDQTNEQIILSNMLMDIENRKRLVYELDITDFFKPKHKNIFIVIKKMVEDGLEYNEDTFYTTANYLKFSENDYGGIAFLREIESQYVPNNPNIDSHVKTLKEDAIRAHMYEKDVSEVDEMFASNTDVRIIAEKLSQMSTKLMAKTGVECVIDSKSAIVEWYNDLRNRGNRKFYATGFYELDENLVEGLSPKKITVWAGFSGCGKTTLMSNMVARILRRNDMSVLFCVLETDRITALDSFACLESGVMAESVIKDFNNLSHDRKTQIYKGVVKLLSNDKLFLVDMPGFGICDLRTVLSKNHFDLVIVDLFEKLKEVRRDLDQKNISMNLDILQDMAKEFDTHIAITAQLNRKDTRNIKGKAKKPQLEYLKNSGKYVEVADLVVGLFRPKVFNPAILEDTIELSILKQRRGSANLAFKYQFNGPKLTIGDFVDNVDINDEGEEKSTLNSMGGEF